MQELAVELITPWVSSRVRAPNLRQELKLLISSVFKIPSHGTAADSAGPVAAESDNALVRCKYCPKENDRKCRHRCHMCKRSVCPRHYYPVCTDCVHLKVSGISFEEVKMMIKT